jgi:hypothetical protein
MGQQGHPLCLIGESGTGKSHLLIALGTEAAMRGFRVRYTLATKLVNELIEAADDPREALRGRLPVPCAQGYGRGLWLAPGPSAWTGSASGHRLTAASLPNR